MDETADHMDASSAGVLDIEFQVDRTDLTNGRIVEVPRVALDAGEIRLRVDRFAFTANNLTYGVAGDMLGYWQFFPAADDADRQWGIIPVWAFADVVESTVAEVPVGDRLYGYFPPATSVVMRPLDVRRSSLKDGTPHRQRLPPLYNGYRRVLARDDYNRAFDDATILLSPLHLTSFCIADQLKQNHFYEADQVLIVSASSKTSLGLAFALSQDPDSPRIIGATSSRNEDFVSGVGLYDAVVSYATISEMLANESTVVVDMAGSPALRSQLASHLGSSLRHYIQVGLTHWEEFESSSASSAQTEPGSVESFFAPSYILEHLARWEPGEFDRQSIEFLKNAAMATFGWMTIEHKQGLDGLSAIYDEVCSGSLPPSVGLVIEM